MRIVSNKISYFTWKLKEKIFESDLVILESDTSENLYFMGRGGEEDLALIVGNN